MQPDRSRRLKDLFVHSVAGIFIILGSTFATLLAFWKPIPESSITDSASREGIAILEAMIPYLRWVSVGSILLGLGILAGWHRWLSRLVRR